MIRTIKPEDIDAIMDIWLKENIKAHHFIATSFWQSNFPYVKDALSEAEVYVYEVGGSIIGFVGLLDDHIEGIFVKTDTQSKGIGTTLINYLKDKHDTLSLHVYKKNIHAIQFYKNNGFVIREESMDEKTQETDYLMTWKRT